MNQWMGEIFQPSLGSAHSVPKISMLQRDFAQTVSVCVCTLARVHAFAMRSLALEGNCCPPKNDFSDELVNRSNLTLDTRAAGQRSLDEKMHIIECSFSRQKGSTAKTEFPNPCSHLVSHHAACLINRL
mmetsp:Transcript_18078/g.28813  ORF Transcript_18078/g.28813 Transcript_18078/m.28813 type:complete len:129 (+) Transcript_18078:177-563(+)